MTAFGAGIHVPGVAGRVDPTKVAETAPFEQPGVVQIAPGQYEVRMIGQIWAFTPNEIRVPAGSTVNFVATSKDVIHGLFIPGANVNVMLIPGQISRVTARFDRAGEYFILSRVLRHRAPHHGRQGHRGAPVMSLDTASDPEKRLTGAHMLVAPRGPVRRHRDRAAAGAGARRLRVPGASTPCSPTTTA